MPKLKNAQHEEFCQQWIIDFNGARAAQKAGGCKERKTSKVVACHWMARADIQKRIGELLKDRSERTQITQDMVIQELAILGFSNFTEFAKYTKGKGKGLMLENTKSIDEEKVRAIKSMKQVETKDGGSISITLHGKEKPLELLGKHVGLFADKDQFKEVVQYLLSEKFLPKVKNEKEKK